MVIVVCLDDRDGMLFHGRRQSQDRALRADLLRLCGGRKLWMSCGSARLFTEYDSAVTAADDFLAQAGAGELCFVEDRPLRPWRDRIEGMVIYRWNRAYPADVHLDLPPAELGLRPAGREEFPGYSHEKLTRETYVREGNDA